MTIATARRAATDQIAAQAISPLTLLAALAMPCVVAFIVHGYAGGKTSTGLAAGIAGIGILDTVVMLIIVGMLGEKQWRTLEPALASPGGLVPLVLGRLAGMAVQSLISIPGTLLILGLLWGISPAFSWGRWLAGCLALAVATTAVAGLLTFVVLRYPFSPGMANGLVGVFMSLGALLVPASAFPPAVRLLAWLMPQSHVMAWVRGGGPGQLLIAALLSGAALTGVFLSVRGVERAARLHAISLGA
ncbi:MAG TPA: hypothetical protein VGG25_16160 [Streptosporangiaceae bacterium]